MTLENIIEKLENEWDSGGFLGNLRLGSFPAEDSRGFLEFLGNIQLNEDELVPKRLISLLWYLPSFLSWQKERVQNKGGDIVAFEHFITEVFNVLERILGVP